jgi:lipoprotein-anchoring transpeptidase ErfK/SrfK
VLTNSFYAPKLSVDLGKIRAWGIHGTQQEWLIGIPSSHGCIRMRNKDIVSLFNIITSGALVLIEK